MQKSKMYKSSNSDESDDSEFFFGGSDFEEEVPKPREPPPVYELPLGVDKFVGFPLRNSYAKVLDAYPLGISIEKYLFAFREMHGYSVNYSRNGFKTFREVAEFCSDVFWILPSPLGERLLFPVKYEGIMCSVETLFAKTWANIEHLLQINGCILKFEAIPQKLTTFLTFHVDPADWSLMVDNAFYVYCFKKFQLHSQKIFVINEQLVKLTPEFPETVKLYNQKKKLDLRKVHCKRLNSGMFVRPGDKVRWMADYIEEETYYKCLASYINDPGHFYVNLAKFWNSLEDLMQNMQQMYNEYEKNRDNVAIPWKELIQVGMFVAAKRALDNEWHRAKILKVIDDEYSVFLLDYGDIITVDISQIRYLFKEFFVELPAQAIRCMAQLGEKYTPKSPDEEAELFDGWEPYDTFVFREATFDQNLAINFKKKSVIEGKAAWEVWIHTLIKNTHDIDVAHVEREILVTTRNGYLTTNHEMENCTETKINLTAEFQYSNKMLNEDKIK